MLIQKGLCEICSPKQWKTISSDKLCDSGYPVYGANGVIGYYSEFNHRDRTLLIACRGTCGSLNICEPFSYVNGNAMALDRLSPEADLSYLYYFLLHRGFSDVITGTAQPQIVRQSLETVMVRYPELERQREISSLLDTVGGLALSRRRQLEKLDELVKARFVELFGDPAANPMNWNRAPLSACLKSIDSGRSFVCGAAPRTGNRPAVLKLSAVTSGSYRPEENKAMLDEGQFVEAAEVHGGDLLFSRKNTPELVGMCAYVYDTPGRLMMPDLIFRLNTTAQCCKMFLWKLINHDLFRGCIQAIATGSAKSMSNISKERLLNLTVILPPIELQEKFAAFAEQTDRTKALIQKSLDRLETLKKSLMQEYFA